MSQRPGLARFLFDATFSSSANSRTWRSVVAAGAMIGATYLATPEAAADQVPPPGTAVTQPEPQAGAQLVLLNPTVDFGSLEAGKKKTYTVDFKNTGIAPLKLDKKKVTSSCKCLVATFARTTIAPGASGKVKLTFTAPRTPGDAEHTVIIKYLIDAATKSEGSAVVTFSGFVEAKRPRVQTRRFEGRGFVLS